MMNSRGDMSGGFNQLGGSYQFINQTAVTNAMASGQDIDWAELAQQWIQMRDNAATTIKDTKRPLNMCDKKDDRTDINIKYEEEGEADMDMDDEDQMDNKDNVDTNQRESTISIMQQRPNAHLFRDKKTSDANPDVATNSQRSWSQWSNNHVTPHTSNINSRQINPTAHIPSLLKINVPHPNEIRALPDIPSEPNCSSNLMDAAKRKGLPAWIRDGLEKMEREKLKEQEKHTTRDRSDVFDGAPISSKKDSINSFNLKPLENDRECTRTTVEISDPNGSRINENNAEISDEEVGAVEKYSKSYEHKLAELMVVVRHTLTELLLEVTNEEISKIANETVKCYKLKGLAAYGDSSSDENSDDGEDENSSRKKTFLSESGNDSEEDLKNAVRMKRRSFLKIANEIEERVSEAAVREEEKLKYFMREEAEANVKKCKRQEKDFGSDDREMVTNESVSAQLSSGCSDKIIGKNYERDSGETTETKLQIINGKRQRDRGALKERITRFSDNRDNRYLPIAATASCITDTQAKGIISNSTIPQPVANQNQAAYKINSLLPSYNYLGISNALKSTETEMEIVSKHTALSSPENEVERREREKGYKRKRHQVDSKSSPHRALSRSSSTSSSSSSSSRTESSTSESSDSSKYSHRSATKHSSQISKKISRTHRDKYDDRKYYSTYDKKSRDSSYSRYRHGRSRSRSRSSRRRRDSTDSDDTYSRRKHSRGHNTSKTHRHFSRSNSRSSYSSSSKRRH